MWCQIIFDIDNQLGNCAYNKLIRNVLTYYVLNKHHLNASFLRSSTYMYILSKNYFTYFTFHYSSYDGTDGSTRTEEGAILSPGTKDEALDVAGAVSWYDNKGHLFQMTYKAGKRGYRTIIKQLS